MRRAALLASLLCLPAATARAYEDRVALGVEAGYTVRVAAPEHGLDVGVNVGFGLAPEWALRLDAAYSLFPEAVHRARGAVEAVYLVDVLQVVPYLGVGAGALVTVAAESARADAEVHAVLGLDVFVDRVLVVGLVVRPILVPTWLETDGFHASVNARLAVLLER